jgi:serine/threonine-protein kinase
MSDNAPGKPTPLDVALRVHAVCRRFEVAWRTGTPPRVEDYLGELPEAERPALLRELQALDDEYRQDTHLRAAPAADRKPSPAPGGDTDTRLGALVVPSGPPVGLPAVPGYEVLAELGKGGMGVVYLARHEKLNRTVALKMLRPGEWEGPDGLARFRREGELLASLQHPNVVQVFDVGEHAGLPFLALEYVPGGPLTRRLGGQPQPPRDAAALVEAVARAVHAAHGKGIVHRDLKPGNILLMSGESPDTHHSPLTTHQAKVADFGLARLTGSHDLTQPGAIVGTPGYMAPEQAGGKGVGPAADVWALGAILYECLTGRPPFKGVTAAETVLQVLSDDPAPVRVLNRRVPRDLETVALKCLEKDPRKRYPSAEALADDLRRFLDGRPTVARPVGALGRAGRWCRRRPREAALGALAAAAVLAGVVTWAVLSRQSAARSAGAMRELYEARGEAVALRDLGRWAEAAVAARRAEGLLAPADAGDDLRREVRGLRAELEQAAADRRMAEQLDQAGRAVVFRDGRTVLEGADPLYAAAFREYGLDPDALPPEEAARRVATSAIRDRLVDALDAWAVSAPGPERQRWLLAVARGADPHPWRDRVRAALAPPGGPKRFDDDALRKLAAEPEAADLPPATRVALAGALVRAGDPAGAIDLLRRVQAEHPDDFRVNDTLGLLLLNEPRSARDEAVRFFTAALAVAPKNPGAWLNLGNALDATGDSARAADCYSRAIRLDPDYADAHFQLAGKRLDAGDLAGAAAAFGEAARLRPGDAIAWLNLSIVRLHAGDPEGATAAARRSVEADAGRADAHYALGKALMPRGDPAAADAFRAAVRLRPDYAEAHCNLGLVLLERGEYADALAALRRGHELGTRSRDWRYPSREWVREAERLVSAEAKLPRVLAGEERPAGPEEAADVARVALRDNRPAAAARLYSEALADPTLTRASALDLVYAARAAARAAAGRGGDAPSDETARASLRRRALDWLGTYLAVVAGQRDSLDPDVRSATRWALERWPREPDLAELRDPDRLPEGERNGWRGLWDEHRRVLGLLVEEAGAGAGRPRKSAPSAATRPPD